MIEIFDRKHKKLFVAEKDVFLQQVYESKFRFLGYENVRFFTDGDAVFEGLKREVPDVILLDLTLSEEDPLAILRYIREDERLKAVPVIALCGVGQEDLLRKGIQMGANDYLVKSVVSLEEVVNKIEKYLD